MSQTLIAAIIFTTTGLLLLLGIPKAKYGKILGALSLIAGILNIVLLLAFRTNWNVSWNANWNTDDHRYVPIEQASKSEPIEKVLKKVIDEKQVITQLKVSKINSATKELWALSLDLIDFNTKEYERLTKNLKRLIKDGADVNIANQYGIIPLYYAAQEGQVDIVKLLLDAGANANATNHDGDTPLWTASWQGYTKIVRMLMKAGADVNKPGRHDEPPLCTAARGGHTKTVELLVKAKADVNAVNDDGETAMSLADDAGYKKIVKILEAYGARR